MPIALYHVDAFAERPFTGNPAAVCLLDAPAGEAWMAAVAREKNLSETAFVHRAGEGFGLRWFTPAVEVDLCGHATLAAAHILWQAGWLSPGDAAAFDTRSGRLVATRDGDWIALDFPATPAAPCDPPEDIEAALGCAPIAVAASRFDLLVVLPSLEAVRGLAPDMARLAAWPYRGTIASARGEDAGCDFVSRFFAPGAGVPEDPVTGSAHCCLGPYWQGRLGKGDLVGRQLSSRGGTVRVRCCGERVVLLGQAVTVVRGALVADASAGV